jgi:hypothetical protein
MTPIRFPGRIPEDWSGDQPEEDSSPAGTQVHPSLSWRTVGERLISRPWLLRALELEQRAADIFHLLEQRRLGGHLTLSSLGLARDRPDSLLVISRSILFFPKEK